MISIWELHKKNTLNALGLMSGTSMDGLDICLAEIKRNNSEIDARVKHYSSYPYSTDFKKRLLQLPTAGTPEICQMNFKIAQLYVDLIQQFLDEFQLGVNTFDLIGSHGQTVWHIHRDSTLQIGEASVLAERFNVPVVSDFRVRDIAAGGSGAPLVPFLDFLVFKKYRKNMMALNIGGIANFTMIPSDAVGVDNICALDAGPGNSLIDITAQMTSGGDMSFDKDGMIARSGTIRLDILDFLLNHSYISSPMPKSTGREIFGKELIDQIVQKFRLSRTDYRDLVATVTRFTAEAIFANYRHFFADRYLLDEIIVSGGGADNPVIVEHLKELFAGVQVHRSDDYGIQSDSKEAFAFAVLSAASVWGITGNVPNVTGAGHPVVLGKITL
jgi:anhydro-N-acetylmuramic acid kinase